MANLTKGDEKKNEPVSGVRAYALDIAVWAATWLLVLIAIIVSKHAAALWALVCPTFISIIHIVVHERPDDDY